jgi:mRNA-degrading endonuclease YafQ of YafQ-DinJ toxin-antitoxin module
MRAIVETPQFSRSFRRFVRRNPALRKRIEQVLQRMSEDVYAPSLGAHKLSGELYGFMLAHVAMIAALFFRFSLTPKVGK